MWPHKVKSALTIFQSQGVQKKQLQSESVMKNCTTLYLISVFDASEPEIIVSGGKIVKRL